MCLDLDIGHGGGDGRGFKCGAPGLIVLRFFAGLVF